MAAARAEVGDREADPAAARVEVVIRSHHAALLRVARRWSASPDDAEDALQRAMEIYVRRLDRVDAATELAWLKVVVRHEAMALRDARRHGASIGEADLEGRVPATDASVEDRLEAGEHTARSLEALARLKPDERRALLLKAEGYSYREIGEREGWTYTKVNRAITEGRRRFLDAFRRIESGEECRRFAPTLLALARGGAAGNDVIALRPHLRHCAGCRATVRELHRSRRHRLVLLAPFMVALAPVRWLGDRVRDDPAARTPDRLVALDTGPDVGALGRRLAEEAAGEPHAAPGAGGRDAGELLHRVAGEPDADRAVAPPGTGADVADVLDRVPSEPVHAHAAQVKAWLHGVLHRLGGPDLAAGVQIGASGGGRGPAVAALLGLCLSGAGAGTYCLTAGVLPDPTGIIRPSAAQKGKQERDAGERRRRARSAAARAAEASSPPSVVAQTGPPPRPAPQPAPARTPRARPAASPKPEPKPAARSRAAPAEREFGFEESAGTPAGAPADGAPVARVATASSASAAPAQAATAPARTPAAPAEPAPAAGASEFLP